MHFTLARQTFFSCALLFAAAAAHAAGPLVIAHRGASGYLPEHTLAGYELAVKLGADYIEPDLQFSRDGVLVAMHDETLQRTTDIAERFTARNGGYKVADFTLAEIRTLTVKPTGTGASSRAGFTPMSPLLRVPTFDEVIALAKAQSAVAGRTVGIYPEAKQADPAMEDQILATLKRSGYAGADAKVFVQSFSDATLRSLHVKQQALGMALPQILLGRAAIGIDGIATLAVSGDRMLSLADIANFAQGIGVSVTNAKYPVSKEFVDQAHAAGLIVHGWTFAVAEPVAAAMEYQRFLAMGLDGLFSNYADLAVRARDAFVSAGAPASGAPTAAAR